MSLDPNNKIEEKVTLYPKDKDTLSMTIYCLKEDFVNNVFFVRKMSSGANELVAQVEFDSTINDDATMIDLKTLNYLEFKDADNFLIKDVLDYASKEIPQLKDIKLNTSSDYYQMTHQNLNIPSYQKTVFNGPTLKDKTRLVTPVFLMEELIDLKMVELKSRDVKGNETRFKFRIGPEQFNIVMTSKEVFFQKNGFGEDSNYAYYDWRHTESNLGKNYNGINLLQHLMDFGVIKGAVFEDQKDKYVKAGRYIIDNILPRVEKRYGFSPSTIEEIQKIEFTETSGSSYNLTHFDRLPLDLSNRIGKYKPATDAAAKWKSWLIDSRKLSTETVNEMFKRKLFYIGQAVVSKKIRDFEPSSDRAKMIGIKNELNAEQNSSFFSKPQLNFIGLDKDGVPSFAEGLREIEDKENKGKIKVDKKHLQKSSPFGSAFKFIQENPKMTIISEAVIDGLSAWDLFKMAGYNAGDFNVVATGGTSHMKNFLEDNFSLRLDFDKNTQKMELSFIEKQTEINDLDEDRLNYLKERFSLWRFQYVTDAKEDHKDIKERLEALEPIIGGPFIIREEKDKNSTYWEKDATLQKKDILFDYTNLDKFLFLNGLTLQKDEDDKYVVKDIYVTKTQKELNPENKKIVLDEIKRQWKTTTMAFAYDNDDAGQKFFPLVDLLQKELNIKVYNLTPKRLKISEGIQYQNKVDVNDILKTFRKYLDKDPSEAQNLLEDFIQPFDPNYLCLDSDIKRIQNSFSKKLQKEKPSP